MLGVVIFLSSRWRLRGLPTFRPRTFVLLTVGSIVVAGVAVTYVFTLAASAATRPIQLAPPPDIRHHLVQLVLVFGSVVLVLASSALRQRLRDRSAAVLILTATFMTLAGCFVMFVMPRHVEYKFLFAALLVVVPVLATGLCRIAAEATGVGPAVLVSALIVTVGMTGASLWRWHVPHIWLAKAVPLDEGARVVHPAANWDGGWMQAVQRATPRDAVLLTGDTDQPISVYTERAVYMTLDESDRGVPRPGRAGYAMRRDLLLARIKGYPAEAVRHRVRIIRECLADDSRIDPPAILRTLAALNRPIAIHIVQASAFVEWLRKHQLGASIYRNGPEEVWLIDSATVRSVGDSNFIAADARRLYTSPYSNVAPPRQ
jgi:hypothetical protein